MGYSCSQERICSFKFVLKFNTAGPLVGLTRCLRAHAQSLSGIRSDVLVILLNHKQRETELLIKEGLRSISLLTWY